MPSKFLPRHCRPPLALTLFRWFRRPIHSIQQLRYRRGLQFQRQREHNMKYLAMKQMWYSNAVALMCAEVVEALKSIDLSEDTSSGLLAMERVLKQTHFHSARKLMKTLDEDVGASTSLP